ncbi:unnamed protein product [Rhodiola kirilowii]
MLDLAFYIGICEDNHCSNWTWKAIQFHFSKVAEELLGEFQSTDLNIPKPFFAKAHRWGSAFPTVSVAKDERCLFSEQKRIAICGDFCVSPSVEGAILSGSAAASKLAKICSCL